MKLFAILLLVLSLTGCGRKQTAAEDRKSFDLFIERLKTLTNQIPPLKIEIKHYQGPDLITREINPPYVSACLAALDETNRTDVAMSGEWKSIGWVEFSEGTNFISRIFVSGGGVLHSFQYSFSLKSPVPTNGEETVTTPPQNFP